MRPAILATNRGFSNQTNRRAPYHRDHDGFRDRDHHVRVQPYFNGGYVVPSWIGAGLWGYPGFGYGDDSYTGSNQEEDSGYSSGGYPSYGPPPPSDSYGPPAPPEQPPQEAERPSRPAYNSDAATPGQAADDNPGLKLIFWDLRPDQTIHNYLVTRNTLMVLDGGHRREIPLVDIDVVGTQEANRDSGVDFAVPTVAK
jgi:hypothetical protein